MTYSEIQVAVTRQMLLKRKRNQKMKTYIVIALLALSTLAATISIAHADTLGIKAKNSPFTEIDRRGRHKKV